MAEQEAGKTESNSNKTSTGIQQNVAGLLCYVVGWITGIIFLILEKDNKFVKFHAIQSIIVFGALTVVTSVLGWIPILGVIVDSILGIVAFVLWIVLMIKAYQGQMFKLPISGNIAEKQIK
jgi:uncharacterized membrane protein